MKDLVLDIYNKYFLKSKILHAYLFIVDDYELANEFLIKLSLKINEEELNERNINNVKKLVMIAPAFEYLNITTIINHIIKPKNKLPQKFTTQFSEVINNLKDYISDNKVPTLIIHCEDDEVIPISSSIKYIEKINHENKILVTLSKGQHRILDDKIAGPIAINLIIDFIENRLLHLKSAD